MPADRRPAGLALAVGAVSAAAFALATPPVPDLWAARAREYAADHGVGLTYWSSWFGGSVPGHYSLLLPWITRAVGSVTLLCAFGLAASTLLTGVLRGARLAPLSLAAGLLAVVCNVWSGRVAFVVGSAIALVALLAVRHARPVAAAALTGLACAVTPVTGAFLALGLLGVAMYDGGRRRAALASIATSIVSLAALGLVFGSPGPEGFRGRDLVMSLVGLAVLVVLRPERRVAVVLWLALPACLVVGLVPNGLGSNFQRMVWFVLPVACLATSTARRRWVALVAAVPLGLGVAQTVRDLRIAADPLSSVDTYRSASAYLARLPDVADHRVEVVPNGTHTEAYALLGSVQLARGYETQSDKLYDDVLTHSPLSAGTLRTWLDDNAVGWVILTRRTLKAGSPEDRLVRRSTPSYLHAVYSDDRLTVYSVADPTPIVPTPGRVLRATESALTLSLPRTASLTVRVRWSHFLTLRGAPPGTTLRRTGDGWLRLSLPRACTCELTG